MVEEFAKSLTIEETTRFLDFSISIGDPVILYVVLKPTMKAELFEMIVVLVAILDNSI
jgi:hypothetical protein